MAVLDFRSVFFPTGKAGRLVYLDVLGTPVPPIEQEDDLGGTHKLNLRIRYDAITEEIVIRPFLYRVEQTREGVRMVALRDTEVRTSAGSQASMRLATDNKSPESGWFDMDFRLLVSLHPAYPGRPPRPITPAEGAPPADPPRPGEPADPDEFIQVDGD